MCATDEGVAKGEQWCKKSIWENLLPQWKDAFGSVDNLSSGDFVNLWTARIDHLANRFSVAGDLAYVSHPSEKRAHPPVNLGRIKLRSLAHARQLRIALAHDKLRITPIRVARTRAASRAVSRVGAHSVRL